MEKTVVPCEVLGSVRPPCSKSYAQRALAAALLARGSSLIGNVELCDDTQHAMRAIVDLGAQITITDPRTLAVEGGFNPRTTTINTGESGLAARLFTPIAALSDRKITVVGEGSMLRRPIGMMIKSLGDLGVRVNSDGYLPITVEGPLHGGEATAEGFVSSQFITGLLMALPLAAQDTILRVENPVSLPYLAMTVDMASRFGIRIQHNDYSEFFVEGGQTYTPTHVEIEGDWGAAAFMMVAGAIAGSVTVENMNLVSLQADVAVIDALRRAGARIETSDHDITVMKHPLQAFSFDATHCPDLFPVLTVLAANCEGESALTGVRRLVHKESNRAEAILEEFAALGMDVSLRDDDTLIIRGSRIAGGTMDSRADHRIAMAGAIAGLTSRKPVTVTGADAVSKSYPRFWQDLESITKVG